MIFDLSCAADYPSSALYESSGEGVREGAAARINQSIYHVWL